MIMFIGTLAGVWPELFGQIEVLRNFDSFSPFPKWILHSDQRRSAEDNFEPECAVLWPLLRDAFLFFLVLSFGAFVLWNVELTFDTSDIIPAAQAIDWTPVNSALLHILSSPFEGSHKVLNASLCLPEPSTVQGLYLHVSPGWPSAQPFGNKGWEGGGAAQGEHQSESSSERELGWLKTETVYTALPIWAFSSPSSLKISCPYFLSPWMR